MGILPSTNLLSNLIVALLYNLFEKMVSVRAEYAFKPKDVKVDKKINISPIDASELSESEIKARISRLSMLFQNKVKTSKPTLVTPCNIFYQKLQVSLSLLFWVSCITEYGRKFT